MRALLLNRPLLSGALGMIAAALVGAGAAAGAIGSSMGQGPILILASLCASTVHPHLVTEARLFEENQAAMNKMMIGMQARPTGDVDRDFVDVMIPHHQGAIDMARTILKFGKNERIKRLAQEIIVTQEQEVTAMHLAIGDSPLPPDTAGSARRIN